ncbi:hypothetical protein ACFL0X_00415 [Nanoarchaeota archaeon]
MSTIDNSGGLNLKKMSQKHLKLTSGYRLVKAIIGSIIFFVIGLIMLTIAWYLSLIFILIAALILVLSIKQYKKYSKMQID